MGDATLSLIEGCLSVPNLRGRVTRHARVSVLARTPAGDELELHAEGLTAGTLQHELDHLKGQLFVDRVTDPTSLTTWSNYDEFWAKGFTDEAQSINNQYPEPLRIHHRTRSSR
jgi:peptide deformylase